MITTITNDRPIKGVAYDKNDPSTREPWLEQRRGGITATEIRDSGSGSKRRKIITAKVTGVDDDMGNVKVQGREHTLGTYARHGDLREPVIAEWIEQNYGITPCNNVYSHAKNPRFLASPDGVTLDPFTGELVVGTEDAVLAEIKTGVKDLTPGKLDAAGILIEVEPGSQFDLKGYYLQMQWQMFVMNATRTLFVHERHDDTIDPETGTFRPAGPPQVAWIMRDQAIIDVYAGRVAPQLLAEIDAARLANQGGMPPASELSAEHAVLVADLLAARDAEAVAKAQKEKAFAALKDFYAGEGKPDVKIDAGDAWVTVSTTEKTVQEFNKDAALKRAPKLIAQYEALVKRYTKPVPKKTQSFTVTAKKEQK
jgi:hypothetical protein